MIVDFLLGQDIVAHLFSPRADAIMVSNLFLFLCPRYEGKTMRVGVYIHLAREGDHVAISILHFLSVGDRVEGMNESRAV